MPLTEPAVAALRAWLAEGRPRLVSGPAPGPAARAPVFVSRSRAAARRLHGLPGRRARAARVGPRGRAAPAAPRRGHPPAGGAGRRGGRAPAGGAGGARAREPRDHPALHRRDDQGDAGRPAPRAPARMSAAGRPRRLRPPGGRVPRHPREPPTRAPPTRATSPPWPRPWAPSAPGADAPGFGIEDDPGRPRGRPRARRAARSTGGSGGATGCRGACPRGAAGWRPRAPSAAGGRAPSALENPVRDLRPPAAAGEGGQEPIGREVVALSPAAVRRMCEVAAAPGPARRAHRRAGRGALRLRPAGERGGRARPVGVPPGRRRRPLPARRGQGRAGAAPSPCPARRSPR